jgi:hypothetical protein
MSRDGGRKQKTAPYGLSYPRRHWLTYKDCMPVKKKKKKIITTFAVRY